MSCWFVLKGTWCDMTSKAEHLHQDDHLTWTSHVLSVPSLVSKHGGHHVSQELQEIYGQHVRQKCLITFCLHSGIPASVFVRRAERRLTAGDNDDSLWLLDHIWKLEAQWSREKLQQQHRRISVGSEFNKPETLSRVFVQRLCASVWDSERGVNSSSGCFSCF